MCICVESRFIVSYALFILTAVFINFIHYLLCVCVLSLSKLNCVRPRASQTLVTFINKGAWCFYVLLLLCTLWVHMSGL